MIVSKNVLKSAGVTIGLIVLVKKFLPDVAAKINL